jgi:hypothetical protein
MKHTPGPWTDCRGADGKGCKCGLVFSTPADVPVASCDMRVEDDGPERFLPLKERQANARLVAAAPDLLEAAEALLTKYDAWLATWELLPLDTDSEFTDNLDVLRTAVKKARGES